MSDNTPSTDKGEPTQHSPTPLGLPVATDIVSSPVEPPVEVSLSPSIVQSDVSISTLASQSSPSAVSCLSGLASNSPAADSLLSEPVTVHAATRAPAADIVATPATPATATTDAISVGKAAEPSSTVATERTTTIESSAEPATATIEQPATIATEQQPAILIAPATNAPQTAIEPTLDAVTTVPESGTDLATASVLLPTTTVAEPTPPAITPEAEATRATPPTATEPTATEPLAESALPTPVTAAGEPTEPNVPAPAKPGRDEAKSKKAAKEAKSTKPKGEARQQHEKPEKPEKPESKGEPSADKEDDKEPELGPDLVFVRAVPAEAPLSKEALAKERLEHQVQKNKAKQLGMPLPHHHEHKQEPQPIDVEGPINELTQVYRDLDSDIIRALFESTSGKFTSVLKTELDELSPAGGALVSLSAAGAICPHRLLAGTPLFFVVGENVSLESVVVCQWDGTERKVHCVVSPAVFGAYELKLHYKHAKPGRKAVRMSVSLNLLVETPVYQLAAALDDLYDSLYWGFNKVWTPELEGAICNLLVAVEDDLKGIMSQFGQQMQMFAMGNSMDNMLEMIQEDMEKSLTEHDFQAVGRLHQTLHSFLELTKMYPFPPQLIDTIRAFEIAKTKGQKSLELALRTLDQAIDRHAAQISGPYGDSYLSHLASLRVCCLRVLQSFDTNPDLSPLWGLKASQTMYFMMNSLGGQRADSTRIAFWPVLPLDKILNHQIAPEVSLYAENLTGEVLMLDTLLGFKLTADVEANIKVLSGLLYAGLGYVASTEGSLVALHGTRRASLFLTEPLVHRKLASRYRDVSRVLRNGKKPGSLFEHKLSLRINTDFDQALAKLRAHHKQSWVNEKLEATWRVMYQRLQLIVIELWYGNTMIAADFGHPGRAGSFYVATRFFEKEYRQFQPGFLLALVELRLLRDVYGFRLWDLGNTDSNPMMSYKEDLTDIMTRPRFVKVFTRLCETNADFVSRLRSGVFFPNIQEHHLIKAHAS